MTPTHALNGDSWKLALRFMPNELQGPLDHSHGAYQGSASHVW